MPIITSDYRPGQPFNLAASVNAGLAVAGNWDFAVIINTDCIPADMDQVSRGILHAEASGHLTLPHDELRLLKRGYYPVIPIDNQTWLRSRAPVIDGRRAPAGLIIMPRTVWDRIDGYDERFSGWGYEDAALLVAAGEFDRLPGPLYHYWHRKRSPSRDGREQAIWEAEYKGRQPKENLIAW